MIPIIARPFIKTIFKSCPIVNVILSFQDENRYSWAETFGQFLRLPPKNIDLTTQYNCGIIEKIWAGIFIGDNLTGTVFSSMSGNRLKELIKPVELDLAEFDRQLSHFIKNDSPLITSIAQHLMKTRGKRLRPAFMFMLSHAAQFFHENTVKASLAIELIHTATLLHDDVVDNSQMRRGTQTVNYKWTNLISVLMGDYLFAKAFRLLAETNSLELMKSISIATERVSIGELRQIEETENYDLSEEEYIKIIADKTGKEPGNDILTGKVTLPLIYSLRNGERDKGREILRILGNGAGKNGFKKVLNYVTESGGIDYAYQRAADFADEGLKLVKGLKDSIYYQSLLGMVDFSTTRAA